MYHVLKVIYFVGLDPPCLTRAVETCFLKTTSVKVRPTPQPTKYSLTQRYIKGHLTSSSAPGLSNERSQSSSFSSPATPKQAISSFTIMTIKRGFTDEADQLLNCLVLTRDPFLTLLTSLQERGIFDALEREYLKSFVFAIYLVSYQSQAAMSPRLITVRITITRISSVSPHIVRFLLTCVSSVVESYTFNFSVSRTARRQTLLIVS